MGLTPANLHKQKKMGGGVYSGPQGGVAGSLAPTGTCHPAEPSLALILGRRTEPAPSWATVATRETQQGPEAAPPRSPGRFDHHPGLVKLL